MKLALQAKVGKDAKGGEGGARAEPASRRQRALRPVESAEPARAGLHAEPAAATYRLERTPIEAPASPLRLVVAGRAAFGRDAGDAAHTERPPTPARGLIAGDPARALSERRSSSEREQKHERRPRRASERTRAKPDRDEPRARKHREGAAGSEASGGRRAAGAKRSGKDGAGAPGAAPAQPVPAPVVAPSPVAAPARSAGAALSGTPAQIQQNLNALPPSAQADVYGGLGSALDASLAVVATQAESAVPVLSASLEGATERPAAPTLVTPAAPAGATPALDSSEPVLQVPQALEPVAVTAPALPAQYPGMKPGEAAPDPAAVGDVLVTLAVAPAIVTTLEAPEIPLEAAADPAQLDTLESGAQSDAGSLLAEAQAGVSASPADVLAPLALQETIVAPALPEVEPLGSAPEVEGMAELASYELGPVDRLAFDTQVGPTLQAAAASAGGELAANEAAFDEHQAGVLAEADAASAAARSEAEAKQQSEVDAARQDLSVEQQSVLDQQQAAADGALADLSSENERSTQEIDDRIATDRATIDSTYARAESDAQAAVDAGATRSENARSEASAEAESDSWWDLGIDGWQWFVQAFADKLVSIAEGVTQAVADVFDASIGLATKLVNGAVNYVKQRLAECFDRWRWLITNLVGSVFPALAEKLTACIDALQAKLFALIDTVVAGYLGLLRWIADGIVAGLSAGIAAYEAGVAAYLAIWEAIQQGQWADLGTMLITALLVTVGISPEEFFATFTKIDEIIAAVAEDPTLVIVNAIKALALGFELFGTHFLGHFMAAAVEWLTGAVSIQMPETFDLAGLFDVVCQVLGLTYDHLREKAVEHVGEGAVTVVEELLAAMWAFVEGGWSGLWTYVKDGLVSLVDDVVMTLGTWLVEKAIFVVTRWVAGLAATMGFSAIVEGLIALWQFTMWLKDQFQRFWQIIKATVDSVHDFVMGNIQPAAETIEATLENLIPPAIDLIAKLLGIGNIPDKVEEVVEGVRKVVDDAIDKVFVSLMQVAGFGGKKKVGEEEQEAEGQSDEVYGALFRKRAITLEGEEHHLYVKGDPGRFDLVIASEEGPAEVNPAVQANAEALGATVKTNDELAALNVLAADPQRTAAEEGQLTQEAKQADAAVVQLAGTLGGPDESRDGPVTLAMLAGPPVAMPRTEHQEMQDLENAEDALRLATEAVEDTAELAEYFDLIQDHFWLTGIGFELLGGVLGTELNINQATQRRPFDRHLRARSLSQAEKGRQIYPFIQTDIKLWSQSVCGFEAGEAMEAMPLGPDHPQGSKAVPAALKGLMDLLPTDSRLAPDDQRYVRGHLLNDSVGGPGDDDVNLFPIIGRVNLLEMAPGIESWVKDRVVKEHHYIYYTVKIDVGDVDLGQTNILDNYVDSTIKYEAGYWFEDGAHPKVVEGSLSSRKGAKNPPPSVVERPADEEGLRIKEPLIDSQGTDPPAMKAFVDVARVAAEKAGHIKAFVDATVVGLLQFEELEEPEDLVRLVGEISAYTNAAAAASKETAETAKSAEATGLSSVAPEYQTLLASAEEWSMVARQRSEDALGIAHEFVKDTCEDISKLGGYWMDRWNVRIDALSLPSSKELATLQSKVAGPLYFALDPVALGSAQRTLVGQVYNVFRARLPHLERETAKLRLDDKEEVAALPIVSNNVEKALNGAIASDTLDTTASGHAIDGFVDAFVIMADRLTAIESKAAELAEQVDGDRLTIIRAQALLAKLQEQLHGELLAVLQARSKDL